MSNTRHLVFVYGTLKAGRGNHHVINSPSTHFLGVAVTNDDFVMFDGAYPRLATIDDVHDMLPVSFPSGRVFGELYSVTDRTLAQLDILEGVEEGLYRRELRRVTLPRTGEECDAFVYVAETDTTFRRLRIVRPVASVLSW